MAILILRADQSIHFHQESIGPRDHTWKILIHEIKLIPQNSSSPKIEKSIIQGMNISKVVLRKIEFFPHNYQHVNFHGTNSMVPFSWTHGPFLGQESWINKFALRSVILWNITTRTSGSWIIISMDESMNHNVHNAIHGPLSKISKYQRRCFQRNWGTSVHRHWSLLSWFTSPSVHGPESMIEFVEHEIEKKSNLYRKSNQKTWKFKSSVTVTIT